MNSIHLRELLQDIWGIDATHLVPMSKGLYAPTIDREDLISSWIGYRIMEMERYARNWTNNRSLFVPIKFTFRQSFVGQDAEEMSFSTFTWDDRSDVGQLFAMYNYQMMYNSRKAFVYALKEEGFNDTLAWIVDISATGVVEIDMKFKPWFSKLSR